MIVKDILPSPSLQEYIRQFRLRHFVFNKGIIPPLKPFPPRPEQSLTLYIRGFETVRYADGTELIKAGAVLSGQFTQRVDRYVSYPEILMLMIDFRPGALYRLTGIPFTEFTNKDLDAETILSSELKNVQSRLRNTDSYAEMISIAEAYMIYLINKSKQQLIPVDLLLNTITKEPDYSLDQLASQACLSPRQLERKFNERIGISPKAFLRISRFNQSYWMHLKQPKLSWFQVAMSCGYTDYQHLVKEYKTFASANPNHFFEQERSAPGRFLGLNK